MKKLFVFIGIALCVASYSSPLSAKENKNTEVTLINGSDTAVFFSTPSKDTTTEVKIIINDDTIFCSKPILKKYGREKIIQTCQEGDLIIDTIYDLKLHSMFYLRDYITIISLKKQKNKIIEVVSDEIPIGEPYTNSIIVIILIFCYVMGGIIVVYILSGIGLFILEAKNYQ